MKSSQEFLSKLEGFFNEKETYLGCEVAIQEMQQRMGESIIHMKRLQKEVREATNLPNSSKSLWIKVINYLFFWT